MSARPTPPGDDPLAALANATAKAVRAEEASRSKRLAEHEDGTARRRTVTRTLSIVVVVAISIGVLAYQGPRTFDPYYGEDPLENAERARPDDDDSERARLVGVGASVNRLRTMVASLVANR